MKLLETVLLGAGAVFVSIAVKAGLESVVALFVALAIWIEAFFLLLRGLIDYLVDLGHVTVPLSFPVLVDGEWKTSIRLSVVDRRHKALALAMVSLRTRHAIELVSRSSGWSVSDVERLDAFDFWRACEAIIPADRVRA